MQEQGEDGIAEEADACRLELDASDMVGASAAMQNQTATVTLATHLRIRSADIIVSRESTISSGLDARAFRAH
jgi:hypothetical protein